MGDNGRRDCSSELRPQWVQLLHYDNLRFSDLMFCSLSCILPEPLASPLSRD